MVETAESLCNESLSSSKLRNNFENSWASCWVVGSIESDVMKEIGFTQLELKYIIRNENKLQLF